MQRPFTSAIHAATHFTNQGPYPPKKLGVPPEVAKPPVWDIGVYPSKEEEYTDLRIANWTAENISKPFKNGDKPRFMAYIKPE